MFKPPADKETIVLIALAVFSLVSIIAYLFLMPSQESRECYARITDELVSEFCWKPEEFISCREYYSQPSVVAEHDSCGN